ncbi:sn-glycerol-3-phosphate ABC transporter ATP-binding protein UgpC [Halostagnicola sp. A-GB9-2]|uniref:ABC transporter ATP-binding protein n=1 Tax=Halostagnicola sp. A-GB9-2 TaxID=3048066 RepID=UPI0024BFF76A|nr:sn-glycerol-3-phosphate ABC transporter ATP-binding protein UgpC [Halostagnicola sp. A-GB9-2]MDJ1433656.1 sn-glycerol-3-phosphate ABC transporter ATP-binding protein UgpC [Halostagnicola sp. A-GB9-2]
MARLALDDVTKEYRDGEMSVVAVEDVSLDVADGEFLVLVGPSGCGKSTTLRMIAGLETITDGEITLDDRSINDVPAQERDIAMVFQSYALYPHKTVRGNMSFGLEESTELSDSDIAETVEETAGMMGIEDLLNRKPGELSGGQQQRVALGRAIVRDPDLFLMDEPLSNLDAKLRAEMRTELQHLQEQLGVTSVYVTHDQTEAMTMGDQIAVLNEGTLQQTGTPLECYHQPNNLFVAGFIGEPSMNFFDGSLEENALVTESLAYSLSPDLRRDIEAGTDLVLGIRPEDVRIDEPRTDGQRFAAEVIVVEPMGNENVIHLRFDDAMAGDEFIVTTEGVPTVSAGDRVDVEFSEAVVHLFDGDSGVAIKNRTLSFSGTPDEVIP